MIILCMTFCLLRECICSGKFLGSTSGMEVSSMVQVHGNLNRFPWESYRGGAMGGGGKGGQKPPKDFKKGRRKK